MRYYEITYIRAGRVNDTDSITVWDGDKLKDGDRVYDIITAIKFFEECAKEWGTHETRHAITDIKVADVVNVITY